MENFDIRLRAAYFALDQQGKDDALAIIEMWVAMATQPPQVQSTKILTLVPRTHR
jgi:hypothetical protein